MNAFAALQTAAAVRARHVGQRGYGIAYGSHASGAPHPTSDLDLLYVTRNPLAQDRHQQLVDDVIDLHHRHGLSIDDEVSHQVKLHATTRRVRAAVRLAGFDIDHTGNLRIPALVIEPTFLNSKEFACRLVLNALTSPHVFLGGDVALYRQHCRLADTAMGLLITACLADTDPFTVNDAAAVLTRGPNGASGKDHLGYRDSPHLRGLIHRALGTQVRTGVVAEIDGPRYAHNHHTRTARVAAFAHRDHDQPPDRILTASQPDTTSGEHL